ncbi:MAG TPA: hypothetical protein VGO07_02270 [Candidatus Saccharimonadales bacterium]|jgi:hypothetical protein|nr:hypothetical protein [Candidatus Saccharimonadales bacterium]
MKRFWFTFSLGMTVSVLIGVLFYVALQRHYPEWDQRNLVNTSLSSVVAMLSGLAASLFVRSVRNFKPELRRAYRMLCIGIILFGLAQVQYPIASYTNASFWYLDGFIALPYLAAALFIFSGVRSFAYILDVRTRWASLRWAVGASVLVAVAVAFLPHARSDFSSAQIAATDVLTVVDAVFLVFVAATVNRIKHFIGVRYASAMQWLYVAFVVNIVAGVQYIVINILISRNDNWYFYDSMSIIPFVIGAILLVRAGYVMFLVNRLPVGESAAARQELQASGPHAFPIIGIITYLATLASKPQEIDPTLDVLRAITSQLTPGQAISEADRQRLVPVYYAVEKYLVTEEPLRAFTVAELRHMVTVEFGLDRAAAAK